MNITYTEIVQLIQLLKSPDENTLIQFLILTVATVGVPLAVWQLRAIKKSEFLETYLAYCSRFSHVQSLILKAHTKKQKRIAYTDYFNLCSEEYFLWNDNYIPRRVWSEWHDGIRHVLKKKESIHYWRQIKKSGWYAKDFIAFIDSCCNAN